MHHPAFSQPECHCIVSESSSLEDYATAPASPELTDDKIAMIRAVLHRLSAIRIINPTDAEDLVQDTLLTMLTKYPESELEKGLLIWSMGIFRKKVGNYYRKSQRLIYVGDQEPGDSCWRRELTAASSPEAKFFQEELRGIIDQTLPLLPTAQRQAIELLLAGLDAGEIVRHLQSERYQNVINHIFRGRQRLAKELAKYGYGPNAKIGMRQMRKCRPKKQP